MSEETKAAFEKMKFYKFYPVQTPDTPDVSNVKVKFRTLPYSTLLIFALLKQPCATCQIFAMSCSHLLNVNGSFVP